MSTRPAPEKKSSKAPPPEAVASGKFTLKKALGSGCFGEVWLGLDVSRNINVAVKLEVKSETQQLANEYEILQTLKRPCQQQGFTEVFHFGREGVFTCLVMEVLGKSLEDLLAETGQRFDVRTTALLGEQITRRLEYLHSKCIIHRDIKPENFMMGIGSRMHIVYLIDFGLSAHYYDEGRHVPQMKAELTGTARYASIKAHDWAQSRRDDLEATGHMLIYFLRGSLPWSGLDPPKGKDKFACIRDVKKATKVSSLCEGLPPQLEAYLNYCRGLGHEQRPDYNRLRRFCYDMLAKLGDVQEYELQWVVQEELTPELLEKMQEWPEIEQPDDHDPEPISCCGCCKRRNPDMKAPLRSSTMSDSRVVGRSSRTASE